MDQVVINLLTTTTPSHIQRRPITLADKFKQGERK